MSGTPYHTNFFIETIYIYIIRIHTVGNYVTKGMNTMNDLLKLWNHVKNTWDMEEIEAAAEDFDFDIAKLNKDYLKKLSSEDIIDLFGDVIDFVMDGFGIDNYGEIYDMLINAGIDEDRAQEIMDA